MGRRKKKKAADLVPRSLGCVFHSFSLIRLALGYKTGLPRGVEASGPMPTCDIPELAKLFFPDHHVMSVISNAEGCFFGEWWDNYITAFCYREHDADESHMVVGDPITSPHQDLDLIVAVSMDRKW